MESLATFSLPGGSSNGVGLQVAPADITLAGVSVPAGSLLISNSNGNPDQITAVNPTTGLTIATLTLQQNLDPVAIVYDDSNNKLFILDGDPDQIIELDANTGATVNTISLSDIVDVSAGGLAIDPTTGNLWVGSSNSTSIFEIQSDGTLVRSIDLASQQLDNGVPYRTRLRR